MIDSIPAFDRAAAFTLFGLGLFCVFGLLVWGITELIYGPEKKPKKKERDR